MNELFIIAGFIGGVALLVFLIKKVKQSEATSDPDFAFYGTSGAHALSTSDCVSSDAGSDCGGDGGGD